jgi:transcriptional regulator with GAF, ATPase, and Fis domain
MREETVDDTRDKSSLRGVSGARPGLLVVFSGVRPLGLALALVDDRLVIGRAPGRAGVLLPDERLSRSHAEIQRTPSGWIIRDLASRNGTFVDGTRVEGEVVLAAPKVIRVADTVLLPVDDVDAFEQTVCDDTAVVGPALKKVLDAVGHAARTSHTLVIQGESGAGKELAARTFHARGPHAGGRFVAVNCAAIPQGLAERLLFGAKRGAYSGAESDSIGHLQAADRGVLFLDEVGDLDPQVQAKLLRVLETREVVPLGASIGQAVDVRVCVATHRDLRAAVVEGKFRSDLYYRLAPPEITLPPLRARVDEIPRHVASAIGGVHPSLQAHARFVEACILRSWPGNVRELRKEVHYAATRALAEGSDRVRAEHLAATAGHAIAPAPTPVVAFAPLSSSSEAPPSSTDKGPGPARRRSYVRWSVTMTRDTVERALSEHGGNVALAARSLGMQRTQLYREMERWEIPLPDRSVRR